MTWRRFSAVDGTRRLTIGSHAHAVRRAPDDCQPRTAVRVSSARITVTERVSQSPRWEMVVTHNPSGEYGHPQHKAVHRHVRRVLAALRKQRDGSHPANDPAGLAVAEPALWVFAPTFITDAFAGHVPMTTEKRRMLGAYRQGAQTQVRNARVRVSACGAVSASGAMRFARWGMMDNLYALSESRTLRISHIPRGNPPRSVFCCLVSFCLCHPSSLIIRPGCLRLRRALQRTIAALSRTARRRFPHRWPRRRRRAPATSPGCCAVST